MKSDAGASYHRAGSAVPDSNGFHMEELVGCGLSS